MPEDAPPTLNWVKARADCSLRNAFNALAEGAEEDTKAVKSVVDGRSRIAFSVFRPSNKRFSVTRIDDPITNIRQSVDFELGSNEITVYGASNGSNEVMFRAGIALNNVGQCKLTIKGEEDRGELEQWQVRRRALEKLFFS
jgi:hypothetical protein